MNEVPIALRPYRKSSSDAQKLRDIIQDLLSKQLIRPSSSPYAAPVSLVAKKNTTGNQAVGY